MQRRIPGSVWLAASAIGFVTAVQAALALVLVQEGRVGWAQSAFAGVLAVTLLGGTLRGSRLAWLWARHLSLFLALIVAARSVVALARGESPPWLTAAVVVGLALPLLAAAVALVRPSALAFHGLVCPACGNATRLPADLLFRTARCRTCGNVW